MGLFAATVRTTGPEETAAFGRALADLLVPGDVVLLAGELGTGKTVLAQGVARGLGVGEPVTSPTFTIVREYVGRVPLRHLDVYRLSSAEDLEGIGAREILDGEAVVLVEWGDRVVGALPPERMEIRIDFVGSAGVVDEPGRAHTDELGASDGDAAASLDDHRVVAITASGPSWIDRVDALRAAVLGGVRP